MFRSVVVKHLLRWSESIAQVKRSPLQIWRVIDRVQTPDAIHFLPGRRRSTILRHLRWHVAGRCHGWSRSHSCSCSPSAAAQRPPTAPACRRRASATRSPPDASRSLVTERTCPASSRWAPSRRLLLRSASILPFFARSQSRLLKGGHLQLRYWGYRARALFTFDAALGLSVVDSAAGGWGAKGRIQLFNGSRVESSVAAGFGWGFSDRRPLPSQFDGPQTHNFRRPRSY